MAANSTSNYVQLDFDTYKQDLITFLRGQAVFKDYDFAGSNMNVLMDVLSYNANKLAFFLNMGISEGFLDSAQLLNSVRSHAKDLNYLPRSSTSALANVTVTFQASGTNQPYIIQKGQSFTTVMKNNSLIFTVPETITCASANTTFTFTTDLYEGIYLKDAYVFQNSDTVPQPRFPITNQNVDLSSLTVTVFEDGSTSGTTFTKATTLLDLNGLSKVFFIQCSAVDGSYEILFGDGNLGYTPKQGSSILFDYRISKDIQGNGASKFTINFDPTGTYNEMTQSPTVVTNTNAVGGAPTESIETTRFYAPRYFETQERCVTAGDYAIALKTNFPEINAINAFGGEQLNPPQFGKVVISVNITGVSGLPVSKIYDYYNFIKGRNPLTITPIFVPADQTYVKVDTLVNYNINVTNESAQRLNTLVTAAINEYNTTYLNDFKTTLRYSKLCQAIDAADPSIVSDNTTVTVYKEFIPLISNNQSIVIDFAMPLKNDLPSVGSTYPVTNETVLYSSTFKYKGQSSILEDDGLGSVRVVQQSGTNYVSAATVGSLNYDTGVLQLSNFNIDSYDGATLCIYVMPRSNDIIVNQISMLSIKPSGINVTTQALSL